MKRLTAFLMIMTFSFALLAGCKPSGEAESATSLVTESEGQYSISLPICGQSVEIDERYEKFLPYVTDELISAADLALSNTLAEHPDDHSGIYLGTDMDGYLCLCTEIIVDLEPAEEGKTGCGIDHDHVFYRERISTEPVT